MGAVETGGDRLVYKSVSLRRLLADSLDGSLEDVALLASHSGMLDASRDVFFRPREGRRVT
jgi:hypothetical protein